MRKHNSKSDAFADLVRSWLPVTILHELAALPEGRQGSDVALTHLRLEWPPKLLDAISLLRLYAPASTRRWSRFLATFGRLRFRFFIRVNASSENQTGIDVRGLTAESAGCTLRSIRSFKERIMTATCYKQVAVALFSGHLHSNK